MMELCNLNKEQQKALIDIITEYLNNHGEALDLRKFRSDILQQLRDLNVIRVSANSITYPRQTWLSQDCISEILRAVENHIN